MFLPILLIGLQGPSHLQTSAPAQHTSQLPTESKDLSDHLGLLLAASVAAGADSDQHHASVFGGIKIGMPVALKGGFPSALSRTMTLDVGYDRMQASHGVSAELSMLLPIARFPTPHTSNRTYARLYFEPGGGYRAGGAGFGSYASAKAMVALFSDDRLTRSNAPPSLFFEVQRRFPLTAPLRGDSRLVLGLMVAVCNHCGLN